MLRIELSGLKRAELKRLLAAAEARGQDGLAETLRAELAGRAAGAPAPLPPLSFEDDEPDPMRVDDDPPPLAFELSDRRAAPARRWPMGLAVVAMLAVGGAAAWGLTGAPAWPGGEGGAPPAPRAMTIRSAPAPVVAPPTEPQSTEPPPAEPPVPEPTTPAPLAPKTDDEVASAPTPRRVDPCAAPPTPADRLLCNDLALNLLERELRDAYGRALSAGADPVAVRSSQAEWRRARDPTSDPRALARLYDSRIRDLRALVDEAPRPGAAGQAPVRQQD